MTSYGRADSQWRVPTGGGLEDVQEESMSMSEVSFDQQAPAHPISTMQGAFEESMQETLADAEESALAKKDAVYRRKVLLERPTYTRMVAGKWMQKKGEKYHPLWKITAQLSFGMHLLHQELAKSDDEVIKILQGHVDEVDGFLERTTEDFDLAQHDINERIRYLQLPLEHGEVFDTMLMDRSFRTAMVDGNVKIEHIVERTAISLQDSLKDVKKGTDGAKELARYLRRLEKTWHGRDEAITEVFQAMMGNTEGWAHAYGELQEKGRVLAQGLEHLRAIIAEIQRLVGMASRRDVPQAYGHSREGSLSRPMSPPRPRTPEQMESMNEVARSPPNEHHSREQEAEPEIQRTRTRTPPALHPNAIIEEEEYDESPPRKQAPAPTQDKSRDLTNQSQFGGPVAAVAVAGAAAGLGAAAIASPISPEETGRMTPMALGRSVKPPHPDAIQEETEDEEDEDDDDDDSVDSDYTIDIVEATPITAMAVGRDLPPHATRLDSLPKPDAQKDSNIITQVNGASPSQPFVLPPLDISAGTPSPMMTPLDYEKMSAIRTPEPFDLQVPNQYAEQETPDLEKPNTSPHPFQRKETPSSAMSSRGIDVPKTKETNIPLAAAAAAAATALVMEKTRAYQAEEVSPSVYTPAPWSPEERVDHSIPLPSDSQFHLQRFNDEAKTEPPVLAKETISAPNAHYAPTAAQQTKQAEDHNEESEVEYTEEEEEEEEPVIVLPPANLRAISPSSRPAQQERNPISADGKLPTAAKLAAGGIISSAMAGCLVNAASNGADSLGDNSHLADPTAPKVSAQPRQLPIDDLLQRLRHGNGLVTPTSPDPTSTTAHSDSYPISPSQYSPDTPLQREPAPPVPMIPPTVIISPSEDEFPPVKPLAAVIPLTISAPQTQPFPNIDNRPANLSLSERGLPLAPIQSQKLDEIMQRRPTVLVPRLQRRSSYSDDSIARRLSALQQSGFQPDLLSPDSINGFPKQYPHSAVVPGSGPWTYFSKDDMDHSYRNRRHHSDFSLASPYDLEWLLRKTPSTTAVSPMRWSEIYDFRSRGNSVVSPVVMTPYGPRSAPFVSLNQELANDRHLSTAKNDSAPVTPFVKPLVTEEPTKAQDNASGTVPAAATVLPLSLQAVAQIPLTNATTPRPIINAPDNVTKPAAQEALRAAPTQTDSPKRVLPKSLADQPLQRNSLLLDLAKARGQLAQAADIKPIQSAAEPTPRERKADRSQVRASSIYSKAPDFLSVVPASPPDVPRVNRSETGYTSHYDDDSPQPSSAYTDMSFGQISPPPDISSAKPSPLHFEPKSQIPNEPTSPASPKEDPKYALEISDEKHTIIEVPPISPSLASLTSATITGPEPDFPFLSGTWGGPEPDYYYPGSRESTIESPKRTPVPAAPAAPVQQVAEQPRAAAASSQRTEFEPQQPISAPYFPPASSNTSEVQEPASRTATPIQDGLPKRGPPPALNLKLFPSKDQHSRVSSPRPQDMTFENGRPLVPLASASMSNSNLLALPPLSQEPLSQPVTAPPPSRSPLKKLFKSALSPGVLVGKLKRDKTRGHQRNSSGQSLARNVALANAQNATGAAPSPIIHGRTNGSIDTMSSDRNGSMTGYEDGRRPSGERVLYGHPGSDGRPF